MENFCTEVMLSSQGYVRWYVLGEAEHHNTSGVHAFSKSLGITSKY
jgi:hypothetical protein